MSEHQSDRCTCRWGRDTDGSEFGPCKFCEEQSYREANGLTDEDIEATIAGERTMTMQEGSALARRRNPTRSRRGSR